MTIEFLPIPLPPSADASKLSEFGREVRGFDPGKDWTEDEFREIEEGLYKVCFLVLHPLGLYFRFSGEGKREEITERWARDSMTCCCLGIASFHRRSS